MILLLTNISSGMSLKYKMIYLRKEELVHAYF